ncbi:MAG: three-Cys-motif partner protein TcmP [Clostridiales bacterium]|nr:three-Cys-motif partner protein TcmP [Clostridiales bacterium]
MSKNNVNFFKEKNSWSEIKDRLLGCYLPQYFQKLLMSRSPIFYVDCFAGKGKFEDGNDGSPRIALQVRQKSLAQTRAQTANIETCFIDLNYADELCGNISEFSADGVIGVVSGRYEEKISELLSNKQNYNVFLYIDPYGIQALDFDMISGFADKGFSSIELLINMNSFGFFRDACRAMSVSKVNNDKAFRDLESELVEYDPADVKATDQSAQLLTGIAGGDY